MKEENVDKIRKRRIVILSSVILLLVIWIVVIRLLNNYFVSSVDDNWEQIKSEKIENQNKICQNLFDKYLRGVTDYSNNVSSNLDIRSSLFNSEQTKLFDNLLKLNLPQTVEVEIFNKRIETVTYSGRHIEPDFLLLKKAMDGKPSLILKEFGFYNYLVNFIPIKDISNESINIGVLVCAYQIDYNPQIKNNYFQPYGLSYEINNILNVGIKITSVNNISSYQEKDTNSFINFRFIDLTGFDGSILGKLKIPNYEKTVHINSLIDYSSKIQSVLIFLTSILLSILFLQVLKKIDKISMKVILVFIILILIRYLWILFEFPNKLLNTDIFSPSFYAVSFSFGMLKSLGDLFITSLFIFVFCIFLAVQVQRNVQPGDNIENNQNKFWNYIISFILVVFSFLITYLFGLALHSIIYDSNIKFLDLTEFLPNAELLFIQLVIVIFAFSYMLLLTSSLMKIYFHLKFVFRRPILRKSRILFIFLILFIISYILRFSSINFEIIHFHRIIIFSLMVIFVFYLDRGLNKSRKQNYLTFKNISYLFLICIFIIPLLLLQNFKNKEVKNIEVFGKELSQSLQEKATFVIADELANCSQSRELYENIRRNNNLPELTFSVWANSKLIDENFNSAVILLDTNEKIISEFNLNPTQIKTDTIRNFVKRKYFNLDYDYNTPDSEKDTLTNQDNLYEDETTNYPEEDVYLPSIYDNVDILRYDNEHLLIGVIAIENIDLRNTQFERTYGYLIIAVNYRFNNVFNQATSSVFLTQNSNSLLNRLFSEPTITEYESGEIINSTNPEISKINMKTLESDPDLLNLKNEKGIWKYESNNNDKYKTFYIKADILENNNYDENDRIFAITIKRDDITITILYYFKFIIHLVIIYIILYIIFSLRLLLKFRKIKFHFREKLFASFFIVSVIPIIFLAVYTRTYIKNKNDVSLQNQILSDVNLISESIKGKKIQITNYSNLDSINNIRRNILDKSLAIPDKNFNLFTHEKLISTTNEELYNSDLLDTRLDADAYYNLYLLKKDLLLKDNTIGGNSFLTGYKPIKDKDNNVTAILSSQSIFKQNEINRELTENLTYIFGSYITAIIILLILVNIFTDRLSKPILELKYATERLSRGQTNFEIRIQSDDELGSLVDSFNKMTKQINRSKIELKKAEREAAWRDIARSVAHEIKNPLTPMKLAIQHLYEIYKNRKNEDFGQVLTKTKDMITNEIDRLNRIATEFSNFAKLPGRNYENIDVNEIIREVVSLYATEPKIEFLLKLDKLNANIYADRQELNRVFQNLIKNAIQSINTRGFIEIVSYSNNDVITVIIKDNGVGIEPEVLRKLFTPNFSTKSTGMGLGLAITKKSLDDIGAEINFESKLKVGTKVKINFKINKHI